MTCCWPAQRRASAGACLPTLGRTGFSLACTPDALPGPLQPNLCYQDLHSALLLDPKHPQAKVLLKVMVGQAQQARQDAGILAVQGKLQHALQCINCAIENNPLDPSLFVFRYLVGRCLSWVPGPALPQRFCVISGEPLTVPRPQSPHLASNNLSLFLTGVKGSWEVVSATAPGRRTGSSLLTQESWTPRPAEQFTLEGSAQLSGRGLGLNLGPFPQKRTHHLILGHLTSLSLGSFINTGGETSVLCTKSP